MTETIYYLVYSALVGYSSGTLFAYGIISKRSWLYKIMVCSAALALFFGWIFRRSIIQG